MISLIKQLARKNLADSMVAMYTGRGDYAGKCMNLRQIGEKLGVTRERVRQILKGEGITGKDSPLYLAGKRRREGWLVEYRAKRVEVLARKAGLSVEDWRLWRKLYRLEKARGVVEGRTAQRRYMQFRTAAKVARVALELNRVEWLELWWISGHYDEIGVSNGCYVMGRIDRAKGFIKGNVVVRTASENALAERVFRPKERSSEPQASGDKDESTKDKWLNRGKNRWKNHETRAA
jgi:hypothetical protein